MSGRVCLSPSEVEIGEEQQGLCPLSRSGLLGGHNCGGKFCVVLLNLLKMLDSRLC